MSDLKARLRSNAIVRLAGFPGGPRPQEIAYYGGPYLIGSLPALCLEAAAEIERLEGLLARASS